MRLQFGEFRFDTSSRQLLRGDEEIHLPPRLFRLLQILLESRPDAVSKEKLIESVWPDVVVEEGNLKTIVSQLRDALGDSERREPWIRTIHRFGYAFRGDVSAVPAPSDAAWQLVLPDGTQIVVRGAEAVIGRNPGSDVWIDSGQVSRRHALLRMRGDVALVEDLGSKNGTLVGGKRISGAVELRDGQRFALGTLQIVLRRVGSDQSTETAGGGGVSKG